MRFNETNKDSNKTTNFEGAPTYKINSKLELYSLVCTASLQRKFYESSTETITRIRKLITEVPAEFVAKLAIYAREKMYLRSIPLVLTVELAKIHKGDKLISNLVSRVIQRADEITELLAYYQKANDRKGTKKLNKLSKQLQKGVARAFLKFDEYNFAKYNRDSAIKLRDALFLSHANPKTEEQTVLFKKIVDNTLEVPYTWEVELSKNDKSKKQVWEELIDSNKLGYMALMRNLRNMLQAEVSPEHINKIAERLSNPEQVRKSRQLPFRFFSAYRELQSIDNMQTSVLLEALEKAVMTSIENVKGYDNNTRIVIACDVSGSMQQSVSPRSKVQYYDIGLMLGMLLQTRCKSTITGIFGDIWSVEQMPKNSVLNNVIQLHNIEGKVGYSTNGYKVLEYLLTNNIETDKVMMFTDNQMWNSDCSYFGGSVSNKVQMHDMWSEYKKKVPSAKLYLFDLAGHGNTSVQVNDNDVFLIAGWSEKVFDVLANLEQGGKTLDEIEKISLVTK